MLKIVSRIFNLADDYAIKLKMAVVFSFFEAIFTNVPIIAVFYVFIKIVSKSVTVKDAWLIAIVLLISLVLRALFRRLVDGFQSGTGYQIFARERMEIGDRLKRYPMGFFSEGNIGNVTAVITSDLVFIEEHAIRTISKVVSGFLSVTIGVIILATIDYRVALITLATVILANIALSRIQVVGKQQSRLRQKTQAELVSVVLEYVKGIAVIKAFNMVGEKARKVQQAFKKTRDAAIEFEEKFIPPNVWFESCFTLGIGGTVLAVTYFALNQTVDIAFLLMMMVFVFNFYLPFKALGGVTGQVRIMEACLDRYDAVKNVDIIDANGLDVRLSCFDIEFQEVNFAYESEQVLKDISFKVAENSMTALVGRSGCGKTTITNLIARFWDVQKGEIKVGGVNVKDMTCDSLLQNISMVFQDVYLFQDTVLNNIKLGKPDATMDEVIEVCKKARCHDFITQLENGYDTVIGEGGSSLSGGEKQRISIARAILKDAPIILLDEATASVDPDNEKHIQMAINELVKNKTLVMIAHRLSTIKGADQILVIDQGEIIERGTHDQLIEDRGQYYDFWQRRVKASSWRIAKSAD